MRAVSRIIQHLASGRLAHWGTALPAVQQTCLSASSVCERSDLLLSGNGCESAWQGERRTMLGSPANTLQTMGLHTSANTNATQAASRANQPAAQSPVVVARRLDNEVGTIYVQCTKNNTICTLVDARGMPVAWTSAGSLGYKNSKKKNVQVSQHVAEDLTEKCLQKGFRTVRIVMKGLGYGKQAAVRAITKSRLQITELHEQTPVPHNGCRAPKRRRI